MSLYRDNHDNRKRRAQRAAAKQMGFFKVATITPDFTVYLDGSPVAVPATKLQGQTFNVGDTGIYWKRPDPAWPVCGRTE